MSDSNPTPPSYTPRPSTGGVWKGIAIACLVLFAFGALAMVGCGYLLVRMSKTPEFREAIQKGYQEAQDIAACRQNLLGIGGAVRRFREHKGRYPNDLKELAPKYLPKGTGLHCPADASDPKTVSYRYEKPTDKTPPETVIVRCDFHRLPNTLMKNGRVPEGLGGL
ncbi:MAG: hypothetical protein IT210_15340 [Armatimonadetes bacterium]|nr:hypothetical protein [Armatimonadota bacterium]